MQTWIVGKWITPREQYWAPRGTHFHQFVVPPILSFRKDCTYGDLAAMRLPEDVEGLGCCEVSVTNSSSIYLIFFHFLFISHSICSQFSLTHRCMQYTMERGVVHACHAGGVVHSLEGWDHHEVGALDVNRIDLVWEAALKHGLRPVSRFTQ